MITETRETRVGYPRYLGTVVVLVYMGKLVFGMWEMEGGRHWV